jgi:hypothetical protein
VLTVLLYTLGITTNCPLGAKMKGFVLFPPLTVGVEFAVSVPSEPIRYLVCDHRVANDADGK